MPEGGRVEAVSGQYRAHQIEPLKSIMLTANAARFAPSASASRRAGWSSAPFRRRREVGHRTRHLRVSREGNATRSRRKRLKDPARGVGPPHADERQLYPRFWM